ncbi:MAG: DUF3298 domain-containing protein [Sneathiellaceae bacterium]
MPYPFLRAAPVLRAALLGGLLLAATGPAGAAGDDAGPSFGPDCTDLQGDYKVTEGKIAYDFVTPRSGDPKVDAALAAFVTALRDEAVTEGSANPPPPDSAVQEYTYMLSCWVARNGPEIASYIFVDYQYTGGAHGISAFHTKSYAKDDNREIALADLFADMDKALPRLSAGAVAALTAKLGEAADADWIAKGAGPQAENFRNFAIGEDALILLFDQYQVGAGYIGLQEVRLPFQSLDGLWSDTAKALLAGN